MHPQYYGAAADYNKPKSAKFFNQKTLLITCAVVAGLILLFIVFGILGAISSGPKNDVARLIAREQQLQNLITKHQAKTTDAELKKASSEASLFLATDLAALTKAYSEKVPDAITASETDTTLTTKLEEAAKASKFNDTYLSTLTTQVDSCLTLAQKVKDQTSGQQTRAAAAQAVTNLTSIANQLKQISL